MAGGDRCLSVAWLLIDAEMSCCQPTFVPFNWHLTVLFRFLMNCRYFDVLHLPKISGTSSLLLRYLSAEKVSEFLLLFACYYLEGAFNLTVKILYLKLIYIGPNVLCVVMFMTSFNKKVKIEIKTWKVGLSYSCNLERSKPA